MKKTIPGSIEQTGGLFIKVPEDDDEYVRKWLNACKKVGIPVEEITLPLVEINPNGLNSWQIYLLSIHHFSVRALNPYAESAFYCWHGLQKANQKGVISIQRMFLIDSSSIERSLTLVRRTDPDYIEVLPGIIPKMIKEIHSLTNKHVFAGGLIDTIAEVEQAYQAGAITITASNKELWKFYDL